MSEWPNLSIPRLVLAALVVAVLGMGVFVASTSSASFSTYNYGWDGTSDLGNMAEANGVEVQLVRETAAYSSGSPDDTVAFVTAPESAYRPMEVTHVKEFVRDGGTVVVADDFGPNANALLRALNASARLDGRQLRDVRSHYRSSAMPVATEVTNHSLVAGVDSLTLNYGTAVEPNNATPLVNTSEYAYIDADRSDGLGPNETLGSYAVVTVESVGEGRVVTVGDPSVFINAMLDRPGNRRFVRVLLAHHDRLLVDYSHAGAIPPLVLGVLVVRDSAALQFGVGALVVGALAVWSGRPDGIAFRDLSLPSRLRPWRGDDSAADVRATTAELAAHLERRHPDWDRERVERVAAGLEERRNR